MLRTLALLSIAVAPSFCADWNPRLAADYLDARQKAWFEWAPAKATGGPCFSCHTGATYLLARPALRRILGETRPTPYETGLLDALRARVDMRDPQEMFRKFGKEPAASQSLGVEAVFAAMFLSPGAGSTWNEDARKAFDRLWSLQLREGPESGAWSWFSLDLDPYEMPPSKFFGAAFGAMAVSATPAGYRNRPEVRERVGKLTAYFSRQLDSQPLHNRLMLLWASTRLPDALPPGARKSILDEVWNRQNDDGGWTLASLGPWKPQPAAIATTGSNGYATALATFVLSTAGVPGSDQRLGRAVRWLESHQDRERGYWAADSMNKKYPAGSMQESFMRDAATAFAAMALAQEAKP